MQWGGQRQLAVQCPVRWGQPAGSARGAERGRARALRTPGPDVLAAGARQDPTRAAVRHPRVKDPVLGPSECSLVGQSAQRPGQDRGGSQSAWAWGQRAAPSSRSPRPKWKEPGGEQGLIPSGLARLPRKSLPSLEGSAERLAWEPPEI